MVGSLLLVFFLFFSTQATIACSATPQQQHQYLKLRLVHHRNPSLTPHQTLLLDTIRLSSLCRSATTPRASPLVSGATTGSGQYFVRLRLGTPPQPILLVADTGSDLVWVRCSACRSVHCSLRHPPNSAFFPRRSTTFLPFHCYHPSCRLVPAASFTSTSSSSHCSSSNASSSPLHTPCRYRYTYADRSFSSGFFSHDVATFPLVPSSLSFGCAFNTSGPSFQSAAVHGVMGLGRGPTSFPSQLLLGGGKRSSLWGGSNTTFSYCLKDYTLSPPPTSYLLIGNNPNSHPRQHPSYTPLLVNTFSPTFYYVGIQGFTVDNTPLPIDPRVFALDPETGTGGTIIDSGTTLTFLPEPAYRQILAAMEKIVRLPRVTIGGGEAETRGGDGGPAFDLCVNVTGLGGKQMPRLRMRMSGGVLFSPPPRNYFVEAAEGVRCLALQPLAAPARGGGGGFGVIGNLMQQGFLFVFDGHLSRLSFSRSGCTT